LVRAGEWHVAAERVALDQFGQSLGASPAYRGTFTDIELAKLRFVDALCRQAAQRFRWRK
jgi:hypothetical protein